LHKIASIGPLHIKRKAARGEGNTFVGNERPSRWEDQVRESIRGKETCQESKTHGGDEVTDLNPGRLKSLWTKKKETFFPHPTLSEEEDTKKGEKEKRLTEGSIVEKVRGNPWLMPINERGRGGYLRDPKARGHPGFIRTPRGRGRRVTRSPGEKQKTADFLREKTPGSQGFDREV